MNRMEQNISSFLKLETFKKLYNIIKKQLDENSNLITIEMINQRYQDLRAENEININMSIQINEPITDYNQIVDQIIQMAPAYQKDEINQDQKIKRIKKLKKSETKREDVVLRRILSSQRKDDQLSNIEQLSQQQISYLEDANIMSNLVNQMRTSNQFLRFSGSNLYSTNEQLNLSQFGQKKMNLYAEQIPRQSEVKKKSQKFRKV